MNFNRTFLSFVSFLIFYIIIPLANANSFWIDNSFVQIQEWQEQDTILNNDVMISNISLRISVDKKILNSTNNKFSITFVDPSYKILDIKPKVCCKAVFINKTQPYYQLVIEINPSNLNWDKFYDYTFFDIEIDYKSKNYLNNDKIDKMIFITTHCAPKENCPKPDSLAIKKTVLLPNDIILRNYPKGTFFGRDVNELIFQDFTPIDNKYLYYDTKAIMYTDLKKEREDKFIWNLFGVSLGALFGLILGFITNMLVSNHYYKKSKIDFESEILNINQKLKNKLSTNNFNKKYKSLENKLKNLTKPKK